MVLFINDFFCQRCHQFIAAKVWRYNISFLVNYTISCAWENRIRLFSRRKKKIRSFVKYVSVDFPDSKSTASLWCCSIIASLEDCQDYFQISRVLLNTASMLEPWRVCVVSFSIGTLAQVKCNLWRHSKGGDWIMSNSGSNMIISLSSTSMRLSV